MDLQFTITIFLIFISCNNEIKAKQFTRCQLVKELEKHNFERSYLSNWVCLVENESNRNTNTYKQYPNLSSGFGLFQINNKTGCRIGRKGGLCVQKCEDFLDENINDDVGCAKSLWNEYGFKLWTGWVRKCRGKRLPDIFGC